MNSVPITDILPWGDSPPTGGRTVVIYDSAETNGRFLLHTIASQCLRPQSRNPSSSTLVSPSLHSSTPPNPTSHEGCHHVLWIHCGTKTEGQLLTAMKKCGCDTRGNDDRVSILFIPIIESEMCLENQGQKQNAKTLDPLITCDEGESLQRLYKSVHSITSQWSKYVIILDDVTFMSAYFGGHLTMVFLQKIRSLVRRQSHVKENSFILLASNDVDQENFIHSVKDPQDTNVTGRKIMQYIGAGGKGMLHDPESLISMELGSQYELEEVVWERALVEIADGVVDVLPLPSGFAKDVHGRLVFTVRCGGGLGWKDREGTSRIGPSRMTASAPLQKFSSTVVNYCCTDTSVRAIRLRV